MSGLQGPPGAKALDETFARAHRLHREGRPQDAEPLYAGILAADPRHFGARLYLGVLRLQQGRAQEAAALIADALAQNPRSAEAHADYAAALRALERNEEAIRHYEEALALAPALVEAGCGLASLLQALGRHEEAIPRYRAALAEKPDFAEAWYGLGTARQMLARHEEAIDAYLAALAVDPDYAEAHYGLAAVLQALGRHQEAIRHYESALDVDPDYIEAQTGLAGALCALKRYEEAVARCRQALALDPQRAEAHDLLGTALSALERYPEAIGAYAEAMRLKPALLSAVRSASAHQFLNRHEEAIALCREALAIDPRSVEAYNTLGGILGEEGRFDEARRVLETAIEIAPRVTGLYANMFTFYKVGPDDPYLARLEALAPEREALGEEHQVQLDFALGKAYADLGRHERSFQHLLAGNALKRRQVAYDEAAAMRWFDSVRKSLTAAVVRERRGLGDPSPLPVFIVGMMRSGSTLVEQILASHPKVHAGGERSDFGRAMHRLLGEAQETAARQGTAAILTADRLRRLGAAYVAGLRTEAPQAARITDKQLANFHLLGLIHLALPNARIIHTRRDPIDTCLSCFSQSFTQDHPYTQDLGELGRYYRAYQEMMAHWRGVLPAGVMLEVDYEDVVDDFEREAQRILAHCGLEWDDACRSFYRTQRPVRTASVAQVRQPIYRNSVGRWRPEEAVLRPLLDGLALPR